MDLPDRFAREAERLVGTKFRLHGRDAKHGVDCVGLVVLALRNSGRNVTQPAAYSLRNTSIARQLESVAGSGLVEAGGPARRGDLVLVRPGPAQHHLMISVGEDRFVHAHAGLRRVVVQTGLHDIPILYHWRLGQN